MSYPTEAEQQHAITTLKILHIEDNPIDAELISTLLRRGGIDCEIDRVEKKDDYVARLSAHEYSIILADYTLPGFDGAGILRLAQQFQPDVPFLFVSATLGDEVAIEMLKSGATDFVLKHSLARLLPAVKRALREKKERDKARAAEEALQRSEKRFRFLAEASQLLASSLDYHTTLPMVARLAVPQLADWCSIYTVEEDETIQPLTIAHVDEHKLEWAHDLLWKYPVDPGALHGYASVTQTGMPLLLEDISDAQLERMSRDHAHLEALRSLGMRSYLAVPLVARERNLGCISFGSARSTFGQFHLEIAEDLARRAASMVENAKLYQEAQEAVRVRDEFLSIASHELKTPLTSLQLEVQMLLRLARRTAGVLSGSNLVAIGAGESGSAYSQENDPAACKSGNALTAEHIANKMETLEKQTKKLSKLINNLLDVSRIAAGRFEIRREEVDLTRVVNDVLSRFEQQFMLAGCSLKVNAAAPVVGMWDRLRVEQVVTNIISNALKYGRGRPIDVSVSRTDCSAHFQVTDSGIGIAPEHLGRIFERFTRATTSKNYGGLGLGLYIVKQIIDALGGRISVNSELGKGSTFIVELPLAGSTLTC
ncbi:MAG TPA: ATP-binding protein [Planctomycetota bacterium]|nr:ATP-binding protein [Planctomycetota bacterium]